MACFLIVSLLIIGALLNHGFHIATAQSSGSHADVYAKMCADVANACFCNAHNLVITPVGHSASLPCGSSVKVADLASIPTIKAPNETPSSQLTDSVDFAILIVDRDAPGRANTSDRYYVHALYVDVTGSHIQVGNVTAGTAFFAYEAPNPTQDSGAHTYQIILLKQNNKLSPVQNLLPHSRSNIDVQRILELLHFCSTNSDSFVGASEFFASSPDNADPNANINRDCPVSTATPAPSGSTVTNNIATATTTAAATVTAAINTTVGFNATNSSASIGHSCAIHSLILTIACRELLP